MRHSTLRLRVKYVCFAPPQRFQLYVLLVNKMLVNKIEPKLNQNFSSLHGLA